MASKRLQKKFAKKTAKRKNWYCSKRLLPTLEKVSRTVSTIVTDWIFKPIRIEDRPRVSITWSNVKRIKTLDQEKNLSDYIVLNAFDFYTLIRWLRQRKISLDHIKEDKIVFYRNPLTSRSQYLSDRTSNFFICLERNQLGNWIPFVRAEEYLLANNYHIACLPRQ